MSKKNRNKKTNKKTAKELPEIENPDIIDESETRIQQGSIINLNNQSLYNQLPPINDFKPQQAHQIHKPQQVQQIQVQIGHESQNTKLIEQYKMLETEINRLNIIINSKDNENSELIKEISKLKDDEINRLKNLVEQLTEEKNNLLKELEEYKLRIERLENANEELTSQSIIQDLLANMFRYFIMLNKDDEIFNPFIKISKVHGREDIEEINLNIFHRALKHETKEASFIKSKFAKFASNLLTYDYVQKNFYQQICKSRNNNEACHSIGNIIYGEFDSFLNETKDKIDRMKFFSEHAKQIFQILEKNILKTENTQ